MSAAAVLEELAVKLGLDVDEVGFFKANAALDLVKEALGQLKEFAREAWEEMKNLAPETARYARAAELAALRTGLTTEAFQELQFAAAEAGISAEGLESALFRMSRAAYEAKHGGGEAAEAFKGLLSLQDLKTLNPDEMFMKLADSLSHVSDVGKRNNQVMQIFGRSMGAEIIPLLNDGTEGLEKLREAAHTYGAVLDKDTIAAAERFRKNNLALEHAIDGLKMAIGGELLKFFGDFKKTLAEFFNAIRPGVVFAFRIAIRGLAMWLRILWAETKLVLLPFRLLGDALLWLTEHAFKNISYALKQATGFLKALEIAALVAAGAFVAAWLAGAAPIVLIIGLIGVLLLVLEDVYTFFEGGDSYTGDMVKGFKEAWPKIIAYLKEKWVEFEDWFVQKVKDLGHALWSAIVDAFRTAGAFWMDMLKSIPGLGKLLGGQAVSFGGGDSPQAQAAASGNISNENNASRFQAQIQVNVPAGTSNADTIGKATADALGDWHNSLLRDAGVSVGGY